jgi:hypothetical protein
MMALAEAIRAGHPRDLAEVFTPKIPKPIPGRRRPRPSQGMKAPCATATRKPQKPRVDHKQPTVELLTL